MTPLEVAISQLGMKEDPVGSNWGKPVQDYLASVGVYFPAAWCMAFVYWCVEYAPVRVSNETGMLVNPLFKTAGVLRQWEKIDHKYKFPLAEPGDIFIMDFGGGLGHTGFVEYVQGDLIHTVEGNTNDSDGREGYEVCRKIRHASKCVGFIRLPEYPIA